MQLAHTLSEKQECASAPRSWIVKLLLFGFANLEPYIVFISWVTGRISHETLTHRQEAKK